MVEVRCTDLLVSDADDLPIRRMTLGWDASAGWTPLGEQVTAVMLHPVFQRERTDKRPDAGDCGLSQLTSRVQFEDEAVGAAATAGTATVLKRAVWSKETKGLVAGETLGIGPPQGVGAGILDQVEWVEGQSPGVRLVSEGGGDVVRARSTFANRRDQLTSDQEIRPLTQLRGEGGQQRDAMQDPAVVRAQRQIVAAADQEPQLAVELGRDPQVALGQSGLDLRRFQHPVALRDLALVAQQAVEKGGVGEAADRGLAAAGIGHGCVRPAHGAHFSSRLEQWRTRR